MKTSLSNKNIGMHYSPQGFSVSALLTFWLRSFSVVQFVLNIVGCLEHPWLVMTPLQSDSLKCFWASLNVLGGQNCPQWRTSILTQSQNIFV